MNPLVKHSMIVLMIALTASAPSIGAIPAGCTEADRTGNADVVAPPGAIVLNWTSDCVVIPNGGSVTWTYADARLFAHASRATPDSGDCWEFARMTALGTEQTLSIRYDAGGEALFVAGTGGIDNECDESAFVDRGDHIEITYDCAVHGDLMTATIRVLK